MLLRLNKTLNHHPHLQTLLRLQKHSIATIVDRICCYTLTTTPNSPNTPMNVNSLICAVLCLAGMTVAAPRPHTGMINDDRFRDVGAIYSQTGYEGEGAFLLAVKAGPECMPL